MTSANPSNTDIAQQWADRYAAQHQYLTSVYDSLVCRPDTLMTTPKCTECDLEILADDFETSAHWIMWDPHNQRHIVVIGCEGYWLVNPASLGIKSEYWMGIEGVNV